MSSRDPACGHGDGATVCGMSEPFALYLRLETSAEAFARALDMPVTVTVRDPSWNAWWQSREMVGASALELPELSPSTSARSVLQTLIDQPDRSGFFTETDDTGVVIGIPLCTENYRHLAALALIFDHLGRASDASSGTLLVFDAMWGSESVMLSATIDGNGLHPTTATDLSAVHTDIVGEAAARIAHRVDELSRRDAD